MTSRQFATADKYFKVDLELHFFYFISLCVVGCTCYGSIPELTLDVFYPLFPWNEEHNEIFELPFHLPEKLFNRVKNENTIG